MQKQNYKAWSTKLFTIYLYENHCVYFGYLRDVFKISFVFVSNEINNSLILKMCLSIDFNLFL